MPRETYRSEERPTRAGDGFADEELTARGTTRRQKLLAVCTVCALVPDGADRVEVLAALFAPGPRRLDAYGRDGRGRGAAAASEAARIRREAEAAGLAYRRGVRAWGAANGWSVSVRGPIHPALLVAYEAAVLVGGGS